MIGIHIERSHTVKLNFCPGVNVNCVKIVYRINNEIDGTVVK